jgi:hypothetical protein
MTNGHTQNKTPPFHSDVAGRGSQSYQNAALIQPKVAEEGTEWKKDPPNERWVKLNV